MKMPMSARCFLTAAILAIAAAGAGCSHAVAIVPPGPMPRPVARVVTPLPVPDPATVAANADVKQIADANTKFGFQLLGELAKAKPGQNVFFSPFSITNALTMLLTGAAGQTQTDVATALSLRSLSTDRINQANALLLPSLEHPDPGVELDVANALWADKSITLAPPFVHSCAQYYQATAASLDFNDPSAAGTINQWASDNTKGKIGSIVTPGDLSGAQAVLSNAVYFHGKWRYPFDKSDTQDGPFTLDGGSVKTLPMMTQDDDLPYIETDQFQMVSVPYEGNNRMSMYLIVPKTNLGAVLRRLDAGSWQSWIRQMHTTYLTLFLPRFQVAYSVKLKEQLAALGMGSAFTSDADFGPMGLPTGTAISQVLHKAIMQVDEQGTVAAAVTVVEMEPTAAAPPPAPTVVVRVDSPFFCAIRDNLTGTLLFAGAIYAPDTLSGE